MRSLGLDPDRQPDRFTGEEEQDDEDGELWRPVEDRCDFLGNLQHRRLCITVDAGVGKSICVEQLAHVRQCLNPGHLVLRFELSELRDSFFLQLSFPNESSCLAVLFLFRESRIGPWPRKVDQQEGESR